MLFTRVPLFPPVSYVQSFRNLLEVERAMIASRASHSGFSGIGGFPSFVGASSEGIAKEEQRGIKGHMYEKAH